MFASRLTPLRGLAALASGFAMLAAVPQTMQGQEEFQITGTVIDESTGEPLQYAVVGVPGLQSWDLTDENGVFVLERIQAGVYRFVATRRGFYYADQDLRFSGPMEISVAMSPEEASNPVGPGNLQGIIRDQENGRGVDGVTVTLEPTNQETTTNSQGRFSFTDVSQGALLLTARRVGYQPRSDTLVAFPGITVDVDLTISQAAMELEPIQVVARAPYLEARGFYRRARTTNGWQANRRMIDEVAPSGDLTRLFRTIPGVSVGYDDFGATVLESRRGRCELSTWLDGMRTPGLDVSTFPPEAVEAMEVYVGVSTPMEYSNNCGALLIWSRRPDSQEYWNRAANQRQ